MCLTINKRIKNSKEILRTFDSLIKVSKTKYLNKLSTICVKNNTKYSNRNGIEILPKSLHYVYFLLQTHARNGSVCIRDRSVIQTLYFTGGEIINSGDIRVYSNFTNANTIKV